MDKVKYLIIGAGVSGLSFANFIKNDYLILEKESCPGGYCKTTYRGEFVWDYAGHFFHFNRPEIKDFFLRKMNQSDLTFNKKCTKVYLKGRYVDYPFQKNIHQLSKEDFIECLYELYFRKEAENSESFQDMLYAKFGKGITELFLKPYNQKLYACDLNILDCNAMGRFFPYASVDDIIANFKNSQNESYNDTFMYHKKGAFAFIDALLQGITEEKIKYGEYVIKIDSVNKKVYTSKNNVYEYEYLICSSDFVSTLRMINEEVPSFLTCNRVNVFNLGFDSAPNDTSIHWIYYPEDDYIFYRVGFYNNILNEKKMSLYVEIGRPNDYSDDEKLDRVIMDLKKVGIVTNQNLIEHEFITMAPAYVHISKDSIEYVNKKINEYKGKNIHLLGRYGRWEYSSIEDAVITAKVLAESFLD